MQRTATTVSIEEKEGGEGTFEEEEEIQRIGDDLIVTEVEGISSFLRSADRGEGRDVGLEKGKGKGKEKGEGPKHGKESPRWEKYTRKKRPMRSSHGRHSGGDSAQHHRGRKDRHSHPLHHDHDHDHRQQHPVESDPDPYTPARTMPDPADCPPTPESSNSTMPMPTTLQNVTVQNNDPNIVYLPSSAWFVISNSYLAGKDEPGNSGGGDEREERTGRGGRGGVVGGDNRVVGNASVGEGTSHYTVTRGASMTFQFKGTAVYVLSFNAFGVGNFNVTLDGLYQQLSPPSPYIAPLPSSSSSSPSSSTSPYYQYPSSSYSPPASTTAQRGGSHRSSSSSSSSHRHDGSSRHGSSKCPQQDSTNIKPSVDNIIFSATQLDPNVVHCVVVTQDDPGNRMLDIDGVVVTENIEVGGQGVIGNTSVISSIPFPSSTFPAAVYPTISTPATAPISSPTFPPNISSGVDLDQNNSLAGPIVGGTLGGLVVMAGVAGALILYRRRMVNGRVEPVVGVGAGAVAGGNGGRRKSGRVSSFMGLGSAGLGGFTGLVGGGGAGGGGRREGNFEGLGSRGGTPFGSCEDVRFMEVAGGMAGAGIGNRLYQSDTRTTDGSGFETPRSGNGATVSTLRGEHGHGGEGSSTDLHLAEMSEVGGVGVGVGAGLGLGLVAGEAQGGATRRMFEVKRASRRSSTMLPRFSTGGTAEGVGGSGTGGGGGRNPFFLGVHREAQRLRIANMGSSTSVATKDTSSYIRRRSASLPASGWYGGAAAGGVERHSVDSDGVWETRKVYDAGAGGDSDEVGGSGDMIRWSSGSGTSNNDSLIDPDPDRGQRFQHQPPRSSYDRDRLPGSSEEADATFDVPPAPSTSNKARRRKSSKANVLMGAGSGTGTGTGSSTKDDSIDLDRRRSAFMPDPYVSLGPKPLKVTNATAEDGNSIRANTRRSSSVDNFSDIYYGASGSGSSRPGNGASRNASFVDWTTEGQNQRAGLGAVAGRLGVAGMASSVSIGPGTPHEVHQVDFGAPAGYERQNPFWQAY